MKYFELKMTVYSLTFGEGKVIKISDIDESYPIAVKFIKPIEGENGIEFYTLDGRYRKSGGIDLSKTPLQPIVNEPIKEKVMGYFWFNCDSSNAIYAEYSHEDEYNLISCGMSPTETRYFAKGINKPFTNFSTEIPSHLK